LAVGPSHPRSRPVSTQVAERYGLNKAPKLVDIIAAVPEEARDQLLPR
jgi:histone acetyltransferase (RNA polymerase elongator complex component)